MIVCRMSWPPELMPGKEICPLVSVAQLSASKVATANVLDMASDKERHAQRGRWKFCILIEIQYTSEMEYNSNQQIPC